MVSYIWILKKKAEYWLISDCAAASSREGSIDTRLLCLIQTAFVSHCSSQKLCWCLPLMKWEMWSLLFIIFTTHYSNSNLLLGACKMLCTYMLQVCKSPNCTYRLSNNLKKQRQVNSFLCRDPTSICSHELARAAANAWSQITTSEQSRFYPTIWSLICLNPPLCCALNPQQSLIPL